MNIFFPIETLSREFEYKLVLAQRTASEFPDCQVYIGASSAIDNLRPFFSEGVYIGFPVFSSVDKEVNRKRHACFKNQGIDFIYFHEEGAIWYGDHSDWVFQMKCQYDLDVLGENDRVCLWGETQKEIDEGRNMNSIPLFVTGCPRLDLNRVYPELYKAKVDLIKEKFGNFILINGNYACNHGAGFQGALDATYIASGSDNLEEHMEWFMNWYVNEEKRMLRMIELVIICAAKHSHINFVFRPHPSENINVYDQYFAPHKNIHVVREGAVNPFIIASMGVIHEGCTTGLESVTAGKPVINYKISDSEYNIYLTSLAGYSADKLSVALELVNKMVKGDLKHSNLVFDDKAKSLLYNLANSDSFDRFFHVISNTVREKKTDIIRTPSVLKIQEMYLKRKFLLKKKKVISIIKRDSAGLKKEEYFRNKFPGLKSIEIRQKLDVINERTGQNVKCKFYNSDLVRLHC